MRYAIDWVCDSPSPYDTELFRALAADPVLDLTVHFIRKETASHPWQTALTHGFVSRPYRRALGIDWRLLRLARSNRRRLLVTGSWNEISIQLALTIRNLLKRPYVVWTDTPSPNARRSRIKSVLRSAWLKWIFRGARAVMGTGAPALAILREMGCPKRKLIDFPYFINVDAFQPRRDGAQRNEWVFVSAGRLDVRKGYDLALRALASLHQEGVRNFRYLVAGSGSEETALRRMAKELGILEQVKFLGWLEPDVLVEFYTNADLFLHPARFEPYGVAVLEAMASGLVVIASDATAAAVDRIRPGVNGFLHRSEDPDALADQIRRVMDRRDSIDAIGQAARETAEAWPLSRAVVIIRDLVEAHLIAEPPPTSGQASV